MVKDVVLVHGAFTSGYLWTKLIPHLEARRLRVTAAQHPLTSLKDDVLATERIISQQPGPVLLVGHAWAGATISEAGISPKVLGLVYVAACVPDQGESLNDVMLRFDAASARAAIQRDDAGVMRLSQDGLFETFAHKLPMQERRLLLALQRESSANMLDQPLKAGAWRAKPSWHVIADQDRMLPAAMQLEAARRTGGVVVHMPSGHLPMLECPELLADTIANAAESLTV